MGNIFETEPTNMQKPHYKVLVIGMSGAGKTTTINMLINQAMSVQYQEERQIAITQIVELFLNGQITPFVLNNNIKEYSLLQSDQLKQSADSQTTKCNIYEINTSDYIISFIDTPGVGDSGGREVDKRNQAAILEFVQQHLDISCILYVHRSTDTRESLNLNYNNPLNNILPDQIRNNCIVCFTSVINQEKIDAMEVLKKQGIPLDRRIFFENDCLIPLQYMPFTNPYEQKTYVTRAEIFWKRNKQQFDALIQYLQQMRQSRKVQQMTRADFSYKTQALMKMIHLCISKSEQFYRQQKLELKSIENKKKQLKELFNSNNLYGPSQAVQINQAPMLYQIRQPKQLNSPVMFCYICSKICHQKCTEVLPQNGIVNIKQCRVFCEGKYEECTCSHHFAYHSHTNEIQEDAIQSFGQNLTKMETQQSLQKSINESAMQFKQVSSDIEDALSTVVQLERIINEDASIPNFKSQIMQEYLQHSTKNADENMMLTVQQHEERIKDLKYLKYAYEKQKSQLANSLRTSQQKSSLEQKEMLTTKIEMEIKRFKQQYSH